MKSSFKHFIIQRCSDITILSLAFLIAFFPYGFEGFMLTDWSRISLQKTVAHAAGSVTYGVVPNSDIMNLSLGTTDATIGNIAAVFSPTGDRLIVAQTDEDDTIRSYSLSTAFDLSTASTESTIEFGQVSSVFRYPTDMVFGNSGNTLYMTGRYEKTSNPSEDVIYQYTLSTPYDISTAGSLTRTELDPTGGRVTSITFSADGTNMYILEGGDFNIYTLSTAWNINSRTYVIAVDLDPLTGSDVIQEIDFNSNGDKLLAVGTSNMLYQFDLATDWDLSTATLVSTETLVSTVRDVHINDDESKIVVMYSDGTARQYDLPGLKNGFVESAGNDGSIYPYYNTSTNYIEERAARVHVQLSGNTFQDTDADNRLDVGTEVNITNLPTGIVIDEVRLSQDDTVAEFRLTGTSTSGHTVMHSLTDLQFEFENAAFVDNNAAGVASATGPASSNVGLRFYGGIGPGGVETGLDLWLRADTDVFSDQNENGASCITTTDAQVVESWHDQSGNHNHFDEANSGDPRYVETALNFNPAIDFDGSDNLTWDDGDVLWYEGDAALDHFSLIQSRNVGLYGWVDTNSGDSSEQLFANMNSNDYSFGAEGTASPNSINTSTDVRTTEPISFNFSYDGGGTTVDEIYDAYINSEEFAVNGSNTSNGTIGTGSDFYLIGNNDSGDGSANDWDGYIPELFQYNRILTDTERQKVNSYMAVKYGLTFSSEEIPEEKFALSPYVAGNAVTSAFTAGQTLVATDTFDLGTVAARIGTVAGSPATINVVLYVCDGAITDTACIASSSNTTTLAITANTSVTSTWNLATPYTMTSGSAYTIAFKSLDGNWGIPLSFSSSPAAGSDYVDGTHYKNGSVVQSGFGGADMAFVLSTPSAKFEYIASDSTSIWLDDSDGYDEDIVIIGRDDSSALDQRVSKSENDTAHVIISIDTDFVSSNISSSRVTSFANDYQFVALAHNGSATTSGQTSDLDTNLYLDRIVREWKVDKTANFTQTVNLSFAGFSEEYYLISSTDGDFSTSTTEVAQLSSSGQVLGATLTDDVFYTLARKTLPGPGGIATGLNLWNKANHNGDLTVDIEGIATNGSDLVYWYNQTSFAGLSNSDPADRAPATYTEGSSTLFNFNASALFDGLGDAYSIPTMPSGDESYNMYAVFLSDLTSSQNTIFANGNNGIPDDDYQQMRITSSGEIEHLHPTVADVTAANAINANESAFVNFFYDTSVDTKTIYKNGRSIESNTSYTNQSIIDTNKNMGYRQGPDNQYFDGYIAEVVIYEDALTDTDRQRIDSYFGIKYGFSVFSEATGQVILSQATHSGGGNFGIGTDRGQSFTAPSTTEISAISIYGQGAAGGSVIDLHICEGEVLADTCVASPNYTETGIAVDTTFESKTLSLSTDYSIISGSQYTFVISLTSGTGITLMFHSSNPYSGGQYSKDSTYDSSMDLRFELIGTSRSSVDYIASDGTTVIWEAAANSGYLYNIFGIARDDYQSLDQRVSRSFDSGGDPLIIALDNDFSSDNESSGRSTTTTNDMSFLMLANNGAATSTQTSEVVPGYSEQLNREWKVDATNFTQSLHLKFEGYDADYYLVSDADGDFTSGASLVGQLSSTGTISSVTLTDGMYITLAKTALGQVNVAFTSSSFVSADEQTDVTLSLDVWGSDLSGESAQSIVLLITTSTATLGSEYSFATTTVTIPAADYTTTSSVTTTIVLTNDLLVESDEYVYLSLSSPSSLVVTSSPLLRLSPSQMMMDIN